MDRQQIPDDAVPLDLPFAGGRWLVQNSPANRVPSRGTNALGSSHAIDFVPVDERGAMGWFCPHNDPSVHLEHFGGGMGFWNVMRIHPETGYGAIVMSNITRHWNITALADEAIGHISTTRTDSDRPDRDRRRT